MNSSTILTPRVRANNVLPYTLTIEGKAETIEQIRERVLNSFQDDARFGLDNIERATLGVFDERRTKQIYIETFPNDRLGTEDISTDSVPEISGHTSGEEETPTS